MLGGGWPTCGSVRDRFGRVVDDWRRPVPVQPIENQHVTVAYSELIQGLSGRQRGAVDAPQAPPTERRTAGREVGATSPRSVGSSSASGTPDGSAMSNRRSGISTVTYASEGTRST